MDVVGHATANTPICVHAVNLGSVVLATAAIALLFLMGAKLLSRLSSNGRSMR